jgi:molybdate transport system substrate-binding protein
MLRLFSVLAILGAAGVTQGEELSVAVAANFSGAVQRVAAEFEQATGNKVSISTGSTGKLYAQIKASAPFDVLMAADQETPKKLEAEGAAVSGTRLTYAMGKLVLWSAQPGVVDGSGQVLHDGKFEHLSICNPKLAPYGAAAVETLRALGVYQRLEPRFVQGENIAQAHQFVASGNAELGFVALSQVIQDGQIRTGSGWIVPANLYTPLRQDAILLSHGKNNPAAQAWLQWLTNDSTKAVLRAYGYDLP